MFLCLLWATQGSLLYLGYTNWMPSSRMEDSMEKRTRAYPISMPSGHSLSTRWPPSMHIFPHDERCRWACPCFGKGTTLWFEYLLCIGILLSCLVKRHLLELLPTVFWKLRDAWGLFRYVLRSSLKTVKASEILFLLRTGKASCSRPCSGLKLLGQQHSWYSSVCNQKV